MQVQPLYTLSTAFRSIAQPTSPEVLHLILEVVHKVSMYEGFSQVPKERYYDFMNTEQYQDYMKDYYKILQQQDPKAVIPFKRRCHQERYIFSA
ncbi:hypothetical protein [Sphingobacterium sp. B29]|uniref:hypothetical protein n=1 Tax=Sphingobacterium sp. B29 TaxID=1933220 RepID=UPI001F2BD25C|nr:hypothetical protein [Sphingobacterium sp. B29]